MSNLLKVLISNLKTHKICKGNYTYTGVEKCTGSQVWINVSKGEGTQAAHWILNVKVGSYGAHEHEEISGQFDRKGEALEACGEALCERLHSLNRSLKLDQAEELKASRAAAATQQAAAEGSDEDWAAWEASRDEDWAELNPSLPPLNGDDLTEGMIHDEMEGIRREALIHLEGLQADDDDTPNPQGSPQAMRDRRMRAIRAARQAERNPRGHSLFVNKVEAPEAPEGSPEARESNPMNGWGIGEITDDDDTPRGHSLFSREARADSNERRQAWIESQYRSPEVTPHRERTAEEVAADAARSHREQVDMFALQGIDLTPEAPEVTSGPGPEILIDFPIEGGLWAEVTLTPAEAPVILGIASGVSPTIARAACWVAAREGGSLNPQIRIFPEVEAPEVTPEEAPEEAPEVTPEVEAPEARVCEICKGEGWVADDSTCEGVVYETCPREGCEEGRAHQAMRARLFGEEAPEVEAPEVEAPEEAPEAREIDTWIPRSGKGDRIARSFGDLTLRGFEIDHPGMYGPGHEGLPLPAGWAVWTGDYFERADEVYHYQEASKCAACSQAISYRISATFEGVDGVIGLILGRDCFQKVADPEGQALKLKTKEFVRSWVGRKVEAEGGPQADFKRWADREDSGEGKTGVWPLASYIEWRARKDPKGALTRLTQALVRWRAYEPALTRLRGEISREIRLNEVELGDMPHPLSRKRGDFFSGLRMSDYLRFLAERAYHPSTLRRVERLFREALSLDEEAWNEGIGPALTFLKIIERDNP